MTDIDTLMRTAPVIPVLVIEEVQHAASIAQALVSGGLPVLEVTLRTPAAIEVIREMKQVPGAIVGAGTVLKPADLDAALNAGAEFIVSPGLTPVLGRAAVDTGVPFLPGTANASDIMLGLEFGLTRFKFFPAQASGGVAALKAITAPFGNARFCPTGGITQANAADWLALEAVLCVGGSWLVPRGAPDVHAIEKAAAAAAALVA